MITSGVTKAHKLRKTVGLVTAVFGIATGGLAAVAFTGRVKGDFTISLKQEGIRLAMDTNPDVTNPTTFIALNDYPSFDTSTYTYVKSNGDLIDNESTNNKAVGVVENRTSFFKHTFYVKNLGSSMANYVFSVNITDMEKPTNVKYGYDSLLRVMVYENYANSEDHNYEVYAKAAEYKNATEAPKDENGEPELREPIAKDSFNKIIEGYATPFTSARRICERHITAFPSNAVMRYTVVIWLEGSDTQCAGQAPDGGLIQLGVNIDGVQG